MKGLDLKELPSSPEKTRNVQIDEEMKPKQAAHSTYKLVVVTGSLASLILWGSALLVFAISHLQCNLGSAHSKELAALLTADSNKVFPHLKPYQYTEDNKSPINIKDYREGLFRPSYKSVQWISEPNSYIEDKGTYVLHSNEEYLIKSFQDENYSYSLFNGTTFVYENEEYEVDSLVASPDLTKATIRSNTIKNWRHSSFGNYWLLDIKTQKIEPIIDTLDSKVSLVVWSPSSDHLAFVKENNMFVKNLNSGEINQLSFDGSESILYGRPDWVYEEEVFESDSALWWSPTGDYLTFLRTNDTLVPEFPIPYFVQDDANETDYPKLTNIKYPKAGYSNPIVDMVIYDVESKTVKFLPPTDPSRAQKDVLITEVTWVSDHEYLLRITTRESDLLKIALVDSAKAESQIIRTELADDGWFEITHDTLYIPRDPEHGRQENGYIDTVVVNGYNHLAYFSPPSNPNSTLLTSGNWEVVNGPAAFDFKENIVYFISTEKSSIERHVYSVSLFSVASASTNGIKNVTDTSVDAWYSVSFSSGARYILLNYGGPELPYQKLVDIHTLNETIIEDNEKLSNTLENYVVPKINYKQVNLGKDEDEADIIVNTMETLPLAFDESKKYPVLFFVYGGPGSQLVTKSYAISFSSIIAAELNAVVVTVDGRGTGFMSRHFRTCVRDQLGYYEPRDQIAAAKIWSKKSYIDEERVAIWGWSYGGFMTLKTLETDAGEVFKYGMSVAPVTNWKLYDSIYTERYMHTPQQNPEGYEIASIRNVTAISQATRFLVMHGTGDDNVHFQNTLKLLDQFDLEQVENYDVHIFPDSDHSISYHGANTVVYDKLLRWIGKAFNGDFEDN